MCTLFRLIDFIFNSCYMRSKIAREIEIMRINLFFFVFFIVTDNQTLRESVRLLTIERDTEVDFERDIEV